MSRRGAIIGALAVLGSIVLFIIPFAFIVLTALKSKQEASLRGFSWPTSPSTGPGSSSSASPAASRWC